MHKGLITSSSLYPRKCLNELFLFEGSFLEINIYQTLCHTH